MWVWVRMRERYVWYVRYVRYVQDPYGGAPRYLSERATLSGRLGSVDGWWTVDSGRWMVEERIYEGRAGWGGVV